MLSTIIAIIAILVIIVMWIIQVQRKLKVLEENISDAMNQIGVQLSCRFDALMPLLDIVYEYVSDESKVVIDSIKNERCIITAKSTPEDVLHQVGIISEALDSVTQMVKQYPEIISNPQYFTSLDAAQAFENMVRTSILIYNDSVIKFNCEFRKLYVLIFAWILGFRQRDCLEEQFLEQDILSLN